MSKEQSSTGLKGAKKQRKIIRASMTRLCNSIDKLETSDIETIEVLQEQLEKDNDQMLKFQINNETESETETIDDEEYYTKFENDYIQAKTKLKKLLNLLQPREQKQQVKRSSGEMSEKETISYPHKPRRNDLPTINIPTFDGKMEDYPMFIDYFDSIVHQDDSIDDVKKLHYLKASVDGEAKRLIQSLKITAGNYAIARNILRKRYENRKTLINIYVDNLLQEPIVTQASETNLKKLVDNFNKNLSALKTMSETEDEDLDLWNCVCVRLFFTKLTKDLQREWELETAEEKIEPLEKLITFVEKRIRALAAIRKPEQQEKIDKSSKPTSKYTTFKPQQVGGREVKSFANAANADNVVQQTKTTCILCNEEHLLWTCKKYLDLRVPERIALIKENRLCFNCLKWGHRSEVCQNRHSCRECKSRHHTTVHFTKKTGVDQNAGSSKEETQKVVGTVALSATTDKPMLDSTILGTIILYLYDAKGNQHKVRALYDPGSHTNLICVKLARKLNLVTFSFSVSITGVNRSRSKTQSCAYFNIASRTSTFKAQSTALLVDSISDKLPLQPLNRSSFPINDDDLLADPAFDVPNSVDILLGVEFFMKIIQTGTRMLNNEPILQNTVFGWMVAGKYATNDFINDKFTSFCSIQEQRVDDILTKFWTIEESRVLVDKASHPIEDQFTKSVTRLPDGRFSVALPKLRSPTVLGESRMTAVRILRYIQGSLNKEQQKMYADFLKEYEQLGHMRKVTEESTGVKCYLPHHAVFRESSSTSKVRVVFNASKPTSTGISLNDILAKGPVIQDDLFDILIRFRQYQIAIGADIEKMFRQIRVDDQDQNLQRIVWSENPTEEPKDYVLTTVTYGTTCAPYLATRVLQELANQERESFPVASRVLNSDFYVDDLLSGANDEQHAIQLVRELNALTKKGCLPLRKWASNVPRILDELDEQNSEFLLNGSSEVATLGMIWNTIRDEFRVKPVTFDYQTTTKRSILSNIAHIFDPLGLLAPIVVIAKWLLQQIWISGLKWDDDKIPNDLKKIWIELCIQLASVEICIPRKICIRANFHELHIFSDASQIAYSACVYWRSISTEGEISVRLVCGKTKIAPTKQLSIPRLELCGAVLASELSNRVATNLNLTYSNVHLWTDSTIVISWLTRPPSHWKPFVANRVTKILENSLPTMWRYVPSKENPADVASRGLMPEKLKTFDLWWNGPRFLYEDESLWPEKFVPREESAEKEARKIKVHSFAIAIEPDVFIRYSSFDKLIRVVAYILRFRSNALSKPENRNRGALMVKEFNDALGVLIRIVQASAFSEEISKLKTKNRVSNKSKLRCLNPFTDRRGILRVGGRLQNANLGYNEMHPIVLPAKHAFTTLLIRKKHESTLHGGAHLVHSMLRSTYWIVNGKTTVKKLIRSCVICHKSEPKPQIPIMGQLPESRVNLKPLEPPFFECGIDYGGPFMQRIPGSRQRVGKLYLALFICMKTKAVHLEAVGSLSTSDFMACFHRFIARKGKPASVHSDNGTNLVGAFNEIARQCNDQFVSNQIQWHFIPPGAPNFGGLWEANIKSVKTHLKRTVGNTPLTFEEFSTVLAKIEMCLNNRPLYAIIEDNEFDGLTPNHFLFGSPQSNLLEEDTTKQCSLNLTNRLKLTRQFSQAICKRWKEEYLHTMQERRKWLSPRKNLECGDIVMVKPDNPINTEWTIGRITRVYPGRDQQVRVVQVKTSTSELKRPVSKIALLPVEQHTVDPK